jgi:hypothetical protein
MDLTSFWNYFYNILFDLFTFWAARIIFRKHGVLFINIRT